MGKAKGVGKRGVGSSKSKKTHKQGLRAQFESRHLDQIWEDVRKAVIVHDGKTAPVGTTDRATLDEDLPASGQHYCIPCSRYFVSQQVLLEHESTKPHKRRVKSLFGAKPHTKKDAVKAAGMGAPDNGKKPAVETPVYKYDTEAVGTGVRGLNME
ncbi:hypothetical protein ABBQ32_001292 [Trebouxia sp. C0010 RCD-2024]